MARINLLPWREEQRRQRQQQFFVLLASAVILAGVAMFGVHTLVNYKLEFQEQRNSFLQDEIDKLNKQIAEIRELEKTKKRLLARINIIQELQSSRPEFVHLFDQLVRTLPEGVYLNQFKQEGDNIQLQGTAQSNARVSTYMWNLDKSEWLHNPNLQVIRTGQSDGARVSQFELKVLQSHKKENKQGGGQ